MLRVPTLVLEPSSFDHQKSEKSSLSLFSFFFPFSVLSHELLFLSRLFFPSLPFCFSLLFLFSSHFSSFLFLLLFFFFFFFSSHFLLPFGATFIVWVQGGSFLLIASCHLCGPCFSPLISYFIISFMTSYNMWLNESHTIK